MPRPSGATLDLATDDDDDDGEDDVEGTLPHAIIRSPPRGITKEFFIKHLQLFQFLGEVWIPENRNCPGRTVL